MSENNNKDELLDNNDLVGDEEPIDLIEKNVESLRKKIQALGDEMEDTNEDSVSIPTFTNEEESPKVEDLKETAKTTLDNSFNNIKESATKVINDNPKLKNSLDFIKKNAMKAVSIAKEKVDELKSNPKVGDVADKAGDSLKDFANVAGEKAKEVTTNLGEAIKPLKENVDEFIKKPEVHDALDKVKDTTTNVANKALETVNDFINSTKNKE